MCTAVTLHTADHYFGRNLDLEHSFGEGIVIVPRNMPLAFRMVPGMEHHLAIIGVGILREGYPLWFDGVNEAGIGMAGLNFPDNACYFPPEPGKDNIAPFELIPWILGQCTDLGQVRALLGRLNVAALEFSSRLPSTPLHWMVASPEGALVVESVEKGLRVYENPVGVLTNNPSFPYHMTRLADFMSLTAQTPHNRFSARIDLVPYSRGMGAIGLPGDPSSSSRFVKAAFLRENSRCGSGEGESVGQFFHILSGVEQQRGSVLLGGGKYEYTVYSSCCNLERGIYYCSTYQNRAITGIDMFREDLEGRRPVWYPMFRGSGLQIRNP